VRLLCMHPAGSSCTVDTAIVNSFILFCDLERRLKRNQAAFRAALVDQLLAAGGVVIPPPSAAATPSHADALRLHTAQRRAGVVKVGGEGAGGSGQPVLVAYGQHQMSKVQKKSRGDCAVCSASCYYKCVTCLGTQRFACSRVLECGAPLDKRFCPRPATTSCAHHNTEFG
jgi:hypothetical protein